MSPPEHRAENIVLVGFMGSGKSSIGRKLSRRLGFQFIDTDALIVERAGMPIPDFFALRGEDAFRDLETAVLESIGHLRRCVISTGGGAVLREENRVLLRDCGFVVRLTASEEIIFQRVSRTNKRPLLHTENPRETMRDLLAAREEHYRAAADFTLDTTILSHSEAVESIVAEARRAFLWHGRS